MSALEASSLGRCATSLAIDEHSDEDGKGEAVRLWCGIDWAENHHDVSVVDETGSQRVRVRIEDTATGFARLMRLLAEQNAISEQPITVAIETAKGLLPTALRAAGVPLIAINPLAVSRYRDRHSPSRAKSDAGDAFVLANILRTDPHAHRPLPVDSELAQSIHVLARAHQDAIWDRMQIANKLRSVLREYYPTFLGAFTELASREARAVLHLAPAPAQGQLVRRPSLTAALRRAGRTRGIPAAVDQIHTALHQDQLRQPPRVEAAMTHRATALLHALDTAVANVARLEAVLAEAFEQHPDAEIITSFPGLSTVLGARILAEIGHDRGDSYSAAARNLTNRALGMLHHCLQTRQHYDENKAFPNRHDQPVTSDKPSAGKAYQEAEAQPTPTARTPTCPRPAASIAPPASQAHRKIEAHPA